VVHVENVCYLGCATLIAFLGVASAQEPQKPAAAEPVFSSSGPDAAVKTLRKEYGEDFLKGYHPNTQLGAVLKKEKVESLHDLLKRKR